ncbi:MAG TPA: hypothetical protein VFM18_10040, partial [Methanosarcina sp.]|nr:hypothetical protein [Methanosarcina sp.]
SSPDRQRRAEVIMPISFRFYTFSEKKPQHKESIVYLKQYHSFDTMGFEPRECEVEYIWDELDEEGELTGTSIGFESMSDYTSKEAKLLMLLDGYPATEGTLWIPLEEYSKLLENSYDEDSFNKVCVLN